MLSLDFELRIGGQDSRKPPANQNLSLWHRLLRMAVAGKTPAGQYVSSKTLLANPDEYIGKVSLSDNVFVVKNDRDTVLREEERTEDGAALAIIVRNAVGTVPIIVWGRAAIV